MRLHISRPGILAICLAALLPGWATPAFAASLTVLPGTSSPGSEVLVRGLELPAMETIEIMLVSTTSGAETPLGSGDTDDAGLLFERFPVPDVPAGDYRVTATGDRAVVLATTNHTIVAPPRLLLTPDLGFPDTPVTVEFGPVPAGHVTILYDGVPVLGPVPHGGGPYTGIFRVPADRPVPLGGTVPVKAVVEAGGGIAGVAETSFLSRDPGPQEVTVTQYSGAGEPLSNGEPFTFSGKLNVPANRNPADYKLTLVVKSLDGRWIPMNIADIPVAIDGSFNGNAVFPSLASGAVLALFGTDPDEGVVWQNATTGESGIISVQPEVYEQFEVETIKFLVTHNGQPVEDTVFTVFANTPFVPPNYDFEKQGFPGTSSTSSTGTEGTAAADTYQKPPWSALYAPPNQYQEAIQEIMQQTAMITNPITDCPVTLNNGLTNAAGEFEVSVLPILNWLYDKMAQQLTTGTSINMTVNGPGKATFSVKLQAVHKGLGLPSEGKCGGVRYEFQYDYDTGLWNRRDGPNGPFNLPFDPDTDVLESELLDCSVLGLDLAEIPADPVMPGLPAKEVTILGKKIRSFGAIWAYPNEDILIKEKLPQLRVPHQSAVFGGLDEATLFIGDTEIGPLTPVGALCGADGVDYVIDLPQLPTYPIGKHLARIEATMLGGTPVDKFFQLDVRPGPSWVYSDPTYENPRILWKPEQVTLLADEPVRGKQANETGQDGSGIPYGVGKMMNDNMTSAVVSQVLLPSGSASRNRQGLSESMVANENADDVQKDASGNGSSASQPKPFGTMEDIVVLDTGKIPLFRYAWGIWPIASATVGADIWFQALYAYYGYLVATNSQVLVDLTSRVTALAGLDLWFDLSVIFDVVSISAFALPNFGVAIPLVITDNQLDESKSQPCFNFALDVAYSVAVGWCPFCIKGNGEENLFTESEPNGCSVPGVGALLAEGTQGIAIPEPPAVDRTSIAVDGFGSTTVVWGDATGMLNVQSMQAGQAVQVETVPAGPGAMAPDIAYLGPDFKVMVWAKSGLSEEAFFALGDDVQTATQNQHLVYRVDDGTGWSETMDLTLPTTGDGGVVLAACPWTDPACPSGGEILAVWTHDPAGNLGMHQMKLRYAYFDGMFWTAPQDLDPASAFKDIQPAATYLDGDPVVFWVRDPSVATSGDTAEFDLNQRYLAYRFLRQPAGVEEPSNLPTGIASPSVQAFGTNALAVAFSKATDPESFIGTRRSLHTAFGTQCFQGTCTFNSAHEHEDSLGRRIFVERPTLTRTQQSHGVISFRQLGTDNPLPGDVQGVLSHSGALMQLPFEFNPAAPDPVSDPVEIATGGMVNWKTDAVFDPASNSVLTTVVAIEQTAALQQFQSAIESAAPAGKTTRATTGQAGVSQLLRLPATPSVQAETGQGAGPSPVMLAQVPMLPDFELVDASLEQSWIPEGSSTQLSFTLRNNGMPWTEPDDLTVATYWDGPAGIGQPGPTLALASLPTGQATGHILEIPLPGGFNEDDPHTLYVVANPQGALDEANGTNNEIVLDVGDLPVPQNLTVTDGDATGIVVIHWDPVTDDPRVTGYRVYRRNPDDSVLIVGASEVGGFADFSVYPEQEYEYFVTSHSARLIESAPSDPIESSALVNPDEIFRDSFEVAAP